jgi:hypothetical protein
MVMLLAATAAFAQRGATVESVSGKVELRPAGGTWEPAQPGQRISRGTTISTGFDSRARLTLANSVLEIAPLTRMTLEDLVETSDTISTDVFVRVGRTRASVQGAEGVDTEFRMRSPIAVASVRGTEFTFDTKRTLVEDGTVTVANFLGRTTSVDAGGSAVVQEFGSIQEVRETFLRESSVSTTPGEEEEEAGGPGDGAGVATVVVTIEWE